MYEEDSKIVKWLKFFGLYPLTLHEAVYSGSTKDVEKAVYRILKNQMRAHARGKVDLKMITVDSYDVRSIDG